MVSKPFYKGTMSWKVVNIKIVYFEIYQTVWLDKDNIHCCKMLILSILSRSDLIYFAVTTKHQSSNKIYKHCNKSKRGI